MSVRGLFPLVLGGGLAYWAYTKKEEQDEQVDEEEGELDVLSELAKEIELERTAAAAAEAAAAVKQGALAGDVEVEVTSEDIKDGPVTRKKKSNAKR